MRTKISLTLIISSVLWASSAFAGPEDWEGQFTLQDASGNQYTATHTPNYSQFIFFRTGSCIHFSKGTVINNLRFKKDTDLCTNFNVDTFSAQLQNIAPIIHQSIKLGPTYSNS